MLGKVLILKGDSYKAVGEMFASRGYDVTYDLSWLSVVNLVVFTGGADVSPYIYGEEPHGARGCDPIRDDHEKEIWDYCQTSESKSGHIPTVGICRGGQLLNVLNGGDMCQDHGLISGDVSAWRDHHGYNADITLRVDHHQGMWAGGDMEIVSTMDHHNYDTTVYAGFYYKTKSFCFQPHPEWGHKGTEDYFFELLERFIP